MGRHTQDIQSNTRHNASDAPAPNGRWKHWLTRNLVAVALVAIVIVVVCWLNTGYRWMWTDYGPVNIQAVENDSKLNYEQRMVKRLGPDYYFLTTIKAMTPENAVILYPDRADFMAKPTHGKVINYRGTLTDKLSAVRVLYPRKVVMQDEYGKTPYSDKISHIAIVNDRHRDLVDYPSDSNMVIDVLPINGNDYVSY